MVASLKKKLTIGVILVVALGVFLAFIYEKGSRPEQAPNLLQNLNYVEQIWDSGTIDLGSPGFQQALIRGWSGVKTDPSGTTFAETFAKTATIRFSCLNTSNRIVRIRCKTLPGCTPSQVLVAAVNGRRIHGLRIGPNFQEYSIGMPGDYLVPGMNTLAFSFSLGHENTIKKLGAAFDSVSFRENPQPDRSASFSEFQPAVVEHFFRKEPVVSSPADGALSLYVRVPEGASLKVTYGLGKSSFNSACRFNVEVEPELQTADHLVSRVIENRLIFPTSATDYLDLSRYANKVVRIKLESRSVAGKQAPDRVYWQEARLITPSVDSHPAPEPAAGAGVLANNKTNVVIYLIDAQRADHLQPYGYPIPTSPNINEFAKSSVVFEKAYCQVTWTRSSVASIQSGLYPSSHLVEDRLDAFPDNLPNIQSELKKRGYHTYGFITNGNISSLFNFGKDFDDYVRLGEDKDRKEIHVQSGELVDTVQEFFKTSSYSQPMFLYVHATDPHAPYTPEPQFMLVRPGCNMNDPDMYGMHSDSARKFTQDEINCMMSLYDSETLRADYNFGRLLKLLKEKGMYDNSIIIVTADHGESFFEHGISGHGKSLYEPELRVPIIMHFPGNRFAGERIPQNVRHIDLFPTILSSFSYPIPPSVQGRSLLPMLLGRPLKDEPVFSELLLDQYSRMAMVDDGFKLISTAQGAKYELFDLRKDPGETRNLIDEAPVRFEYMRYALNKWADEEARRKAALKKPKGAVLDKETEDVLKALGYLQ